MSEGHSDAVYVSLSNDMPRAKKVDLVSRRKDALSHCNFPNEGTLKVVPDGLPLSLTPLLILLEPSMDG